MTDTAAASSLPESEASDDDNQPITIRGRSRGPGAGRDGLREWLFRVTPYRVTGLLFLLVLVPMCFALPWSGDQGQHASTIWRLRENFSHPTSPLIDISGNNSPYFAPYQVFGALVSLVTGLVPLKTMHLLAVMNVVLVITGIGAFVRTLTSRPWAPVIALFTYFFLWGVNVEVWSGYESWLSFCLGLSYPSAFAAGLMFWLWAGTLRLLGRVPDRAPLSDKLAVRIPAHVALGLVLFVVLLSHPFTGIVICLGLAGIMIGSLRGLSVRNWLLWVLSAAVTLAAVLVWPYFNLLDQQQSSALDAMHQGLYSAPLAWFGFALVLGLPALFLRFRRNRMDPLVLTFALIGAVVAYGWFSGHYSFGRAYPGLIMTMQLAVAIEAAEIPWKDWFKRELSLMLTVALALGMWVQAGTIFYLIPKKDFPKGVVDNVQTWNPWPGYQWVAQYGVKYGDVVMTSGERPLDQLPAYGYYTVSTDYPDPAVAQSVFDQRNHDVWEFFYSKEATDQDRRDLLTKYHASWVLIMPGQGVVLPSGSGYEQVATSPQGEYLYKVVNS
ncbi:hypothetical protein ACFZB9_12095 [Kitasatospora sp. NPDC008050]|uniref:hypothetical protein n=1 Tax=Kitasatospora sp. NPDC008050 TaxID=3364021 RepID=UPI0036EBA87B